MHYLEDDLDLLDGVPEELKQQCFEMRELDVRVEKALIEVKEESRDFFFFINSLDEEEKMRRRKKIKESYQIIRELSEEKVAIAEFLELMLEKYQERIAKDLNEFKFELEADTPGITEGIEKELCEAVKQSSTSGRYSSRSERITLLDKDYKSCDTLYDDLKSVTKFVSSNSSAASDVRHVGRLSRPDKYPQSSSKMMVQKLKNNNHHRSSMLNNNNSLKRHKFDVSESQHQRCSGKDLSELDREFGTEKELSDALLRSKKSRFALMMGGLAVAAAGGCGNAEMETTTDDSGFEDVKLSKTMAGASHASTSSAYPPTMMPTFAGGQESQYGRPVKLTSRVQQMLKDRQVHRVNRGGGGIAGSSSFQQMYANANSSSSQQQMRYTNSLTDEKLALCNPSIRNKLTSFSRRRLLGDDAPDDGDIVSEGRMDDVEDDKDLDVFDEEEVEEGESLIGGDEEEEDVEGEEDSEDQDNRVWCLCQQKSEGDMVACDNKNCPYEWFHYGCVGITATPKGKWYCPVCSKNMRRSHSMESGR